MSANQHMHVDNCFGCSLNNPIGLKIDFKIESDCVKGEFTPNQNHMGPPDGAHGGVIMTLLDEAMAVFVRAVLKCDVRTAKEEVVFKNLAKIGEKLFVEARLKEDRGRAVIVSAKVTNDKGIVAEATGMLFKVR
ncbi:MAG: PaaI family thioesterase [Candidatus Omnitrophica bacterium]|nr:PaaI family thioesterase [Candidatus Omnitrophota bacterium]